MGAQTSFLHWKMVPTAPRGAEGSTTLFFTSERSPSFNTEAPSERAWGIPAPGGAGVQRSETHGPRFRQARSRVVPFCRDGIRTRPRQAPPAGRRKRVCPHLPDPGVSPRAHACARHAGKAPARRPFCLIGSSLEEAFRPASGPKRLASVLLAFSLAGARAGGSSRPRKAP